MHRRRIAPRTGVVSIATHDLFSTSVGCDKTQVVPDHTVGSIVFVGIALTDHVAFESELGAELIQGLAEHLVEPLDPTANTERRGQHEYDPAAHLKILPRG